MRNDQQLVTALESCQAAPGGFGPEHASLCRDAALRLKALISVEEALTRADETNLKLLREVSTAHLVLAEIDREIVDAALAAVRAKEPSVEAYLPKLGRRSGATDAAVIERANKLGHLLARLDGYQYAEGAKLYRAEYYDPRRRSYWNKAVEIVEHLFGDCVQSALAGIEEGDD